MFFLLLGGVETMTAETESTPAAATTETMIPLAEIAPRLEAAETDRMAVERDLENEQQTGAIEKQLPQLETEVTTQAAATQTGSTPSYSTLMDLEGFWKSTGETIGEWQVYLKKRIGTLEETSQRLAAELEVWKGTTAIPAEAKQRVEQLKKALQSTRAKVEQEKAYAVKIQTRVEPLATKSTSMLAMVRQEMVKGLFFRDKAAIWTPGWWNNPDSQPVSLMAGVSTQWKLLVSYVQRQSDLFTLNVVLFLILAGVLWRLRHVADETDALKVVRDRLAHPAVAALVVSLMVLELNYPQPPRIFWSFWAALALGGSVYLLRRALEPVYRPFLLALLAMLVLDEVREVVLNDYLTGWRLLLLAETVLGAKFIFWFWKKSAFARVPETERDLRWQVFHVGAKAVFLVFATASLANVLGYVRPAAFLCNAVAECMNHATILYALVWLGDAYFCALLNLGPLSRMPSVANHRTLLWKRCRLLLRWGMAATVSLITLQMLEMRHIVWEWLCSVGDTRLSIGGNADASKATLQVKDVVQFAVSIGLAVYLSRFIRFLLSEEVYPRVKLPRGIPYAVSTMIHYVILFIAFLSSVGDMSKFTVLAGAFGVGLGFGLQNIFNNFVSGLILLFERPVKVGDVVQIGSEIGTVERIGIRASVIRTEAGSELIIPNGKLISDTVTNWTFSNKQRGFTIPLSVPRQAEAACILDLMVKAAQQHPKVLRKPSPVATLVKLSPSGFDFELRAWTNDVDDWPVIRSEITVALEAALIDAGILTPSKRD